MRSEESHLPRPTSGRRALKRGRSFGEPKACGEPPAFFLFRFGRLLFPAFWEPPFTYFPKISAWESYRKTGLTSLSRLFLMPEPVVCFAATCRRWRSSAEAGLPPGSSVFATTLPASPAAGPKPEAVEATPLCAFAAVLASVAFRNKSRKNRPKAAARWFEVSPVPFLRMLVLPAHSPKIREGEQMRRFVRNDRSMPELPMFFLLPIAPGDASLAPTKGRELGLHRFPMGWATGS